MPEMIVRLHFTLLDVDPAIWRRIEIPAGSSLKTLHDVLQRAMGWFDYHLHHFEIGGILYGKPSPDDADFDRDIVDERKLKLLTLAEEGDRVFEYVYDYGDNWRIALVLEALQPALPGVVYPRLIEGARRGPPEDVGGPWSYSDFLEAIADPNHEQHAELSEWSGCNFDPNDIAVDDINAALAQLAKQKKPRSKTSSPASKKHVN
jgi:hypothetical protein